MTRNPRIWKLISALMTVLCIFAGAAMAQADRIKDMVAVAGVRSNALVGYGLVMGLAGTGDGGSRLTQQSMQSLISRLGLDTEPTDLDTKNVAAVMVTADMPPFIKPGQVLDVTVSTAGKAKSLKGGTLLMTPLMGADGEVYAIAQGNLVVGGLGVEAKDGSSLVINVPTVGRVPGGATIERMVETPFLDAEYLVLNLHRGDFSTASAMVDAINEIFGKGVAVALDGTSVRVRAPADPAQRVSFMGLLENIDVVPAAAPAQVIVNARTGTVVIGGSVRVTPSAVSHGSLTVRVNEDFNVDQGATVVAGNGEVVVAPGEPVITPDSQIDVAEAVNPAFVFDPGVSLSSLVDAINAVGASPADLVAILEALHKAGSLRAELIII
ncbi:Basal body P-ring protein [Thalassovita gelatinovora]|uniref:Flagellar P-ring protein n=2 Tax=Thalassovita gelatinovora TaxID=53501 RepID=A0A0P1FKA6_THAGE|nr:flagellar basal body P-ring protein FlgI [Thalassovita gelatinovora]CUH68541.1 Basal body P-ring protein [Thalassovita gelatinovora]SEQ54294.1 flagellar P-ring protein precursor FlgI [Thalassovita gelatinovora]